MCSSDLIEWIAENDASTAEFAQQAADGFEVLLQIFTDEGEDGLGSEAELIRDGDADAAVTEIEAQQAWLHSCDGTASTERKPHLRMG